MSGYVGSHFYVAVWVLIFSLSPKFLCAQDVKTQPTSDGYPIGIIDRTDLLSGHHGNAFLDEYAAYEPDSYVLEKLKPQIYSINITLVSAFWCSDSRRQVPRFYKVLDRLRYDYNAIQLISVNMNKQAGETDLSGLGIERVPTFIFSDDAGELGRIIETPTETIEKDILRILSD